MEIGVCIFPAAAGVPKKRSQFFCREAGIAVFLSNLLYRTYEDKKKLDDDKLRVHGQGKEEG